MLLNSCAFAQQIEQPLLTNIKKTQGAFQKSARSSDLGYKAVSINSCMIIRMPFQLTEIKSMPKGVCYTAFFCKMEARICDQLNFWIKLRAGDFDNYETKQVETKKP